MTKNNNPFYGQQAAQYLRAVGGTVAPRSLNRTPRHPPTEGITKGTLPPRTIKNPLGLFPGAPKRTSPLAPTPTTDNGSSVNLGAISENGISIQNGGGGGNSGPLQN